MVLLQEGGMKRRGDVEVKGGRRVYQEKVSSIKNGQTEGGCR